MVAFNKINDWLDNMVENADLASDQFVIALSNTAPGSEATPPTGDGNGILGNVTQISYTGLSSRNITTTSSSQGSGTYRLILADLTLTATGADVGPFRYIYVYDDTVATPVDPLVCYYDYGSNVTITDGGSFIIDFDGTNGLFSIT